MHSFIRLLHRNTSACCCSIVSLYFCAHIQSYDRVCGSAIFPRIHSNFLSMCWRCAIKFASPILPHTFHSKNNSNSSFEEENPLIARSIGANINNATDSLEILFRFQILTKFNEFVLRHDMAT